MSSATRQGRTTLAEHDNADRTELVPSPVKDNSNEGPINDTNRPSPLKVPISPGRQHKPYDVEVIATSPTAAAVHAISPLHTYMNANSPHCPAAVSPTRQNQPYAVDVIGSPARSPAQLATRTLNSAFDAAAAADNVGSPVPIRNPYDPSFTTAMSPTRTQEQLSHSPRKNASKQRHNPREAENQLVVQPGPQLKSFRQQLSQAGVLSSAGTGAAAIAHDDDMVTTNLGPVPPAPSAVRDQIIGRWTLEDIKGEILAFACDQDGSRLVQQLINIYGAALDYDTHGNKVMLHLLRDAMHSEQVDLTQKEKRPDSAGFEILFTELKQNFRALISHSYGNYCIQSILQLGQPRHQLAVLEAMEGHFAQISLDTYGCRVVQCVMDSCFGRPTPQQQQIIDRRSMNDQSDDMSSARQTPGTVASGKSSMNKSTPKKKGAHPSTGSNMLGSAARLSSILPSPAQNRIPAGAANNTNRTINATDAGEMPQVTGKPITSIYNVDNDVIDKVIGLIHELSGQVHELIKDQNGNHVLQKILDRCPPFHFDTSFILNTFVGRHPSQCTVMGVG